MNHERYSLYKMVKAMRRAIIACIATIVITGVFYSDNDMQLKDKEGTSQHETIMDSNTEIDVPDDTQENSNFTDAEDQSSDGDIEEETNERTEEKQQLQRENVLYYVMDSGYRTDIPTEYQDYLWSKCKEYGIQKHYKLLLAQIYHESSFNPLAISKSGDYGLMQINKCNHSWLKKQLGISDFLNPYESIDAGVHIMAGYLKKYDEHKALMSYNMGEGGMKKSGLSQSTYSRGVIADINLLHVLTSQ